MSYEKEVIMLPVELFVNTCPHCNQKFVVLSKWDDGVVEQVGQRIYCYMCGKKFDDALETHATPKA